MLQQPAQMIEALLPLSWAIVYLGLHAVWSVHVCVCTCYSYSPVHACAYIGAIIALAVRTYNGEYTKHCNVNKMANLSWLGPR